MPPVAESTPPCDDLHSRLLAREPTASADLFACYAQSLTRQLHSRGFHATDPDLVHDAIVTALLDYAEHPERFDPHRRSLGGYLYMAARGDLLNLIEKRQRRRDRETGNDPVELETMGRNIMSEQADPVGNDLVDREAAQALVQQAMGVARTEEERIVVRLMLDGERMTDAFSRALGLEGLPLVAQQRQIYVVKDRLSKRLRRQRRSTDA